jgi:hypothetical protein
MKFRPLLLAAAVAAGALAAVGGLQASANAGSPLSICPDAATATFGPDVCVFTPSMTQSQVQADLDAISTRQVPVSAQFTSDRYAVLFEPGTYGSQASPLVFQVGYYTQVAGLGREPGDVVINGAADVFNNLCTPGTSNCNADDNFWRSLSNLTLNVTLPSSPPAYAPPAIDAFGAGCANSAEMWAASQAAPIRRAIINGSVVFQDYCANNNFASGGFIADSVISGDLNFFGNQQYMVRDSSIGGANGCPGGLWNMVYSGVQGAPAPVFTGSCQQNTVLPATPVSAEAPFLYDAGHGDYRVFVPAVKHNASGPAWANGPEAGTSIPLSRFYIATPAAAPGAITAAAARGKGIILTPGVYNLGDQITIPHPGTVILGLGLATLVPANGNPVLKIVSSSGVHLSGVLVDAGPVNSRVLVQVGTPGAGTAKNAASDPDVIQDVYYRIGGAETTPTSATVSMEVNAPYAIIDNSWIWRADHGNNVGWTANKGDTGLVVNGDNVTAIGLAVEHYQKSEVLWNGNRGSDIFYQNELPYDPPSQAAWNQSATRPGYPAFQVGSGVTSFSGTAMGSYVVFINTPATLHVSSAFQAPRAPGVQFRNAFGVWIAGSGGLDSIVNGVGGPVRSDVPGSVIPVDVASYP